MPQRRRVFYSFSFKSTLILLIGYGIDDFLNFLKENGQQATGESIKCLRQSEDEPTPEELDSSLLETIDQEESIKWEELGQCMILVNEEEIINLFSNRFEIGMKKTREWWREVREIGK
jgi:hypothetical protein